MKRIYLILFLAVKKIWVQLLPADRVNGASTKAGELFQSAGHQNYGQPQPSIHFKVIPSQKGSDLTLTNRFVFSSFINFLLPHSNTKNMNPLLTPLTPRVSKAPAFFTKALSLIVTAFLLSTSAFATYGDVGNFVWRDLNCDGIQQSGEPGIAGVKVTLTYPNGSTKATTTTNSSGYYSFNNLLQGNYVIVFTTPSGYTPSPSDRGNDATRDSDPINGKVSVTVYAGENNPCIDAGFCGPTGTNNDNSVGNFVWKDLDCDGVQDSGEPGIGGVQVKLTFPDGTTTRTTTTNSNGNYIFENLAPGNYVISFTTPSGYTPTAPDRGGDATRDSDPINGKVTVTVYKGEDNPCIDAGFCLPVNYDNSVGNFVWKDLDCDGIQDSGEPGIQGVVVTLTYPNGTTATTVTNSSGNYQFTNLPPANNYVLSFATPAGYTPSPADRGGDATKDSDPINGKVTVAVYRNEDNPCIDAGFCVQAPTGSIGNFVWKDLDGDGIQDSGEPGISGVKVVLTLPNGSTVQTTTNASGAYLFSNLAAGNYVVTFTTPAGYNPTPSDRGSDDTKDSDPVNGRVGVTLAHNENNLTIDAGYCVPANYNNTVGDFVWKDMDCDGIQDAGEVGIAGVKVALTTTTGVPVANTVTNASGFYQFTNIAPGNYIVVFTTPDGYTPAPADRGGDFTKDSDPVNGSVTIVVYANEDNPCIDAGFCPAANSSIGDYVWNDLDRDGIQDANEPGFPGVTVILTNTSTGTVTTVTTTATGFYTFPNLSAGVYTVCFVTPTPTAYLPSPANQGSNDAIDSDPVNGCVTVNLGANQNNTTIDAGFYDDIDDDDDGITDLDESGGIDPFKDCDNDGIPNYKDMTPGCPNLTWTDCPSMNGAPDGINDFFDWDKDGIINSLDLDSDNDGILDIKETRDSRAVDANNDGMADGTDVDGDGLKSTADGTPTVWGGPGLLAQDLDRDGLPNYLDLDSDGDGITDLTEATGTWDSDGIVDGGDADNDGVKDLADGIPGRGANGIGLLDSDRDGIPNPYDIDSDDDGITDNVEGQPTCSYTIPSRNDVDKDGVVDEYDNINGTCPPKAPGIRPYDKDGDGTPDIYDLDTDNDGAPDVNEGSGISGNFVTQRGDADGDGLMDQFDNFNIKTATTLFNHNVVHSQMGTNGSFNGPVPGGSGAQLPQSRMGTCPTVDRDWREVQILPVSLVEFKGNLNNGAVKLSWTSLNEVNLSHYIVERSINGLSYSDAGQLKALGNAGSTTYTLTDDISNLGNAVVYYRLKQVDNGGSGKLSNVITFRLNNRAVTSLAVNPNPARNFFIVKVNTVKDGNASIRVMDLVGRIVIQQNNRLSAGTNAVSFNDINRLAAGTYNVQVTINGEVLNQKLVITK